MNYERYEFVRVSEKLLEFGFHSIGPKGKVEMLIKFQRINLRMYNLAFGNIRNDGCIDDTYNIRNQDRNKILATVAAAVYEFTAAFPERIIYFSGSTPARCRLYRMAIGKNLNELSEQFEILGIRENQAEFEVFTRNIIYDEFAVKRK